jgi:hypothetical protein
MDAEHPEERIAELERQLAEQKRIAELQRQIAEARAAAGQGGPEGLTSPGQDAYDGARQYAEAVWEGLRSSAPVGPGGPSQAEMAQHRDAFMHAAAQAGLSQDQIDDIFKHGKATIKVGHSVVYSGQGDTAGFRPSTEVESRPDFSWGAAQRTERFGGQPPRKGMRGADLVGAILGFLGICVGGAAALTAAMPSSALWMSSIVCSSGYHLAYGTSGYSYRPGQSGTSVSFECVGDTDSYSPSWLAIDAFQSLLLLLVVGTAVVVGRMVWRRLRAS